MNAQESEVSDVPSQIESKFEDDTIEGSGNAVTEEKLDVTEQSVILQLEPIITQSDSKGEEQKSENENTSSIDQEEKINFYSGGVYSENNDSVTEIPNNPPIIDDEKQEENTVQKIPCPEKCLCSIEGEENNLVVNCAGYSLTEFPSPLDPRTTTLILNNNKLTEIPKYISSLKNLKVFNANDNSIMALAAGVSIYLIILVYLIL